jgi:glycosyltransferase involved in cell wall biosynthesis
MRDDIMENSICHSIDHVTGQDTSSELQSTALGSSESVQAALEFINSTKPTTTTSTTPTTTTRSSSSSSSSSSIMHEHFTFLYIGRLAVEKQPGLLIRAVLYILNQQPAYVKDQVTLMDAVEIEEFRRSIKVIICGDGELMDVLRDTVSSLGLNDVIVFEGHVDHERLRHVIKRSDALINPIVQGR